MKRIGRSLAVLTATLVALSATLSSGAGANGAPLLLGVHRVIRGPINTEQAFKVTHCIIHYEFGTYDGTAYAKVRATHADRGYACTAASQVVAARATRVVNGPLSVFTCGESIRHACLPSAYLKWAQSSRVGATGFGAYVKINELRRYPPAARQDRITLSAFTPAPAAVAESCTDADLSPQTLVMPVPHRVARHFVLDGGQEVLDPATITRPVVTAKQAWKTAQRFWLPVRPGHSTYQLLLGNLTSYRRFVTPPTRRKVSRLVWMIVGHDVPIPGRLAPPPSPGAARRPPPQCEFGNLIEPIDATTGKSLFWESGLPQVP